MSLDADLATYSDEWCAGFLAVQTHALDEALALRAEDRFGTQAQENSERTKLDTPGDDGAA